MFYLAIEVKELTIYSETMEADNLGYVRNKANNINLMDTPVKRIKKYSTPPLTQYFTRKEPSDNQVVPSSPPLNSNDEDDFENSSSSVPAQNIKVSKQLRYVQNLQLALCNCC
jgi:hypothetical protein